MTEVNSQPTNVPANPQGRHDEMRQMRIELAQSLADDLSDAVTKIPGEEPVAELAAKVRQVQRDLRHLGEPKSLFLVEAVGHESGRPVAHVVLYARDRDHALTEGVQIMPPHDSDRFPERPNFRARPCSPGELIYLDANQGVKWR